MCGIFGYIASDARDPNPDLERLKWIALVTQTRGPHAFGLAWIDRDGRLQTFKAPGPAKDHLEALEACRGASIIVGHCRYATHGSPRENANNHPHPSGRGWIVHNGIVHNHEALAEQLLEHGLRPDSDCDSEVLALAIAAAASHRQGRQAAAAARVAAAADGTMAVLGIWTRPARLLVVRSGRPLRWGTAAEGSYIASLAGGLPDGDSEVADLTARTIGFAPGGRRRRTRLLEGPIALPHPEAPATIDAADGGGALADNGLHLWSQRKRR